MTTRLAIGIMTGTSLDALDAAAVEISGAGLEMNVEFRASASEELGEFEQPLRSLASGEALTAETIADTALRFGELHARAVSELIEKTGRRPDLVCLHGQTVFHRPPLSWQLINPWPIALAAGCPVVYDLRAADLAAGGQGAPITPIADWILFRSPHRMRAVVNLGGFCNITILPAGAPPERLTARDVCACNQILDAAARRVLSEPYDEGGAVADSGEADATAVADLAAVLGAQSRATRSLGTGDEAGAWLDRWEEELHRSDLLASAAQAVAATIAEAVRAAAPALDDALFAGGGARNARLMRELSARLPVPKRLPDSLTSLLENREPVAFAVLGALCQDRVPITLPQVTGVASPAPIAGAWIDLRR